MGRWNWGIGWSLDFCRHDTVRMLSIRDFQLHVVQSTHTCLQMLITSWYLNLKSFLYRNLCSFCACGETSSLGQGELTLYESTPGFNPFKKIITKFLRKTGSDGDDRSDRGQKPLTWRRQRQPPKTTRYIQFI